MVGASIVLALLSSAPIVGAATAPHPIATALDNGPIDNDTENTMPDAQAGVATAPDGAITETSVSAPPIDGFGILEQGKGALPEDIWKGSTRDTADPLLQDMRTGIANGTLQTLVTHLLMTQAVPPQGSGKGQSWFALRINALISIGQDESAEQMISSLPASMADASLLQLQTGLKLVRGEYDNACQNVQPGAVQPDPTGEDFWHKLAIMCQARAGKQDEAMVGVDLLREEHHTDDLFFQEAIRRIGDKTTPIKDNPKQWTLLNVALVRLANDTEKLKSSIEAFPAVAAKYMARDASLDIKLRERAQVRAQLLGVMPTPEGNKPPEQPFSRPLASDVTTLVAALGSDKPPNSADNAVIARLALDESGVIDSRRVQRLLTLMEPFGYHVPQEIWQKLFLHPERFDGDVPPAALVGRINDASNAHRSGEVILLSALITSGSDVDRISDLALLPIIKALIAAGYEKEARVIAHDAVKAYSAR